MSVEIIAEHVNPLLGRKDAKLIVHHEGSGTPDRLAIRKIASDHFKTQQDKVYVRGVRTRTGGSSAICQVEVYGDSKLADKIVPAYIKNRNLPKGQRVSRKKGAEEEKPAPAETKTPAKPEAKPAAKPPAKPDAKQKT